MNLERLLEEMEFDEYAKMLLAYSDFQLKIRDSYVLEMRAVQLLGKRLLDEEE